MAHEFDVIDQFFKPLSKSKQMQSPLDIGIGDDGAVLSCQPGSQLVVVTDTLIEGVHFLRETEAYDIAWKALAVNLSDLAAMGAVPAFFSLALTLPRSLLGSQNSQAWLKSFSRGLSDLASQYDIALVGGDTTHADQLSITITAQGWVETGQAITRGGAQPGDDIYVSGTIGDGGLGLKMLQSSTHSSNVLAENSAVIKLNRPQPRLDLGRALQGVATSAIDISDGLLADLNHILQVSAVGAVVETTDIPISEGMQQYLAEIKDWAFPFRCGDDYELCFTVPRSKVDLVVQISDELALPLTRIGQISKDQGRLLLEKGGQLVTLDKGLGFEHF
ncbi:thiamine-phosphate kinase [Hydrogenovibrio sp. SC-1]|uniref:thiamine-phosphate kinase n=1 Tax=Hydrogenovibrio sp. SC-1 TaxID=2065820 RepID=UPI000C7B101E|nr:thiamine-phosphate kinase [Hydrogenovibrio sp. SC-1]PLA74308.1 thiamine-phosphate kinase [Hydrogenovibrio sp. SC-1]